VKYVLKHLFSTGRQLLNCLALRPPSFKSIKFSSFC